MVMYKLFLNHLVVENGLRDLNCFTSLYFSIIVHVIVFIKLFHPLMQGLIDINYYGMSYCVLVRFALHKISCDTGICIVICFLN